MDISLPQAYLMGPYMVKYFKINKFNSKHFVLSGHSCIHTLKIKFPFERIKKDLPIFEFFLSVFCFKNFFKFPINQQLWLQMLLKQIWFPFSTSRFFNSFYYCVYIRSLKGRPKRNIRIKTIFICVYICIRVYLYVFCNCMLNLTSENNLWSILFEFFSTGFLLPISWLCVCILLYKVYSWNHFLITFVVALFICGTLLYFICCPLFIVWKSLKNREE